MVQRYDAAGTRLGSEFQVNTSTGTQFPEVGSDPDGNFVVVWSGPDGSNSGVLGQRFDATGNRLGTEFQINTYTTGRQTRAKVARDANGNFVVVWDSDYQDQNIFGQQYDAAGNRLGFEFQVNVRDTGGQGGAAVATDRDGKFVVAWHGSDGGLYGIFGRQFVRNLVETQLSDPPAVVVLEQQFSVTDRAKNAGGAVAGPSTTRYYLSEDTIRNAGDERLGGNRVVPALSQGQTSKETVTVTVRARTKLGLYYLLACADDLKEVTEADETDNCRASATRVTVTQ